MSFSCDWRCERVLVDERSDSFALVRKTSRDCRKSIYRAIALWTAFRLVCIFDCCLKVLAYLYHRKLEQQQTLFIKWPDNISESPRQGPLDELRSRHNNHLIKHLNTTLQGFFERYHFLFNNTRLNFLFNKTRLTVNATPGAAWCFRWLCREITEKVSSITIVLRKSSETDAVIKGATSGSRAIGSRPEPD